MNGYTIEDLYLDDEQLHILRLHKYPNTVKVYNYIEFLKIIYGALKHKITDKKARMYIRNLDMNGHSPHYLIKCAYCYDYQVMDSLYVFNKEPKVLDYILYKII